ncbi:hypothetical protein CYMTET_42678 [Cymbomonas tetramitiformis]|uniref:Uncharacterized protein n=1 Tax=Cymbomonas tetramitiformis TaxID=36881 RepID=A0AAE0C3K5_9CHLO|nr:hypothetical protein CYMTET_42678 [Cymbomonas tetramitiformis]
MLGEAVDDMLGAAVGGMLGEAVDDMLGEAVGDSVVGDTVVGVALGDPVADPVGAAVGGMLGEAVDDMLGAAVGGMLEAVGGVVGSAVDVAVETMHLRTTAASPSTTLPSLLSPPTQSASWAASEGFLGVTAIPTSSPVTHTYNSTLLLTIADWLDGVRMTVQQPHVP